MSDKLKFAHKTSRKKLETTLKAAGSAIKDTLEEIEKIRLEVEKIEFNAEQKPLYEAKMMQFLLLRDHLADMRSRRNGIEETLAKMTVLQLQDVDTIDVAVMLGLVANDFAIV